MRDRGSQFTDAFDQVNTEDETWPPWAYLDAAVDPERVVPGCYVIAGAGEAVAVAQVVDVADDGLVHVRPIRGTVDENHHLLDAAPSDA